MLPLPGDKEKQPGELNKGGDRQEGGDPAVPQAAPPLQLTAKEATTTQPPEVLCVPPEFPQGQK